MLKFTLMTGFVKTGIVTEEKSVTADDIDPLEDINEAEEPKNPDEREYVTCTMDELVTEIYAY